MKTLIVGSGIRQVKMFDYPITANCKTLNNDEEMSEKDILKVESIFMSYRNVIAGMDWNGNIQEYEKYKGVKK